MANTCTEVAGNSLITYGDTCSVLVTADSTDDPCRDVHGLCCDDADAMGDRLTEYRAKFAECTAVPQRGMTKAQAEAACGANENCSFCAGPNNSPLNECAIMMWSRTSMAYMAFSLSI